MVSITRVLCPIDFSDCSLHALGYALAIARQFGASVEILHVMPDPLPAGRAGMQARLESIRTAAQAAAVVQMKQAIEAAAGTDLSADTAIEHGNPSAQVVARAAASAPGLVVMGTHGRGALGRLVLGSVAEEVVRQIDCPLLLVPARITDPPAAHLFANLLCPIDFSGSSLSALAFALALTERTNGRLTVLHAIEALADESRLLHRGSSPELNQQLHDDARGQMQAALPAQAARRVSTEMITVPGRAGDEILRAMADRGIDTIVMGVHGRGVVNRLLLGSTIGRVLRAASCPVLTVRHHS